MNVSRILQAISTRAPQAEGLIEWVQRELHPVALRLRDSVNKLSSNSSLAISASAELDPQQDLVLVNSTAGTVTLSLPSPMDWVKRVVIQKTDASANAVTVTGLTSGTATLSGQYDTVEVLSDGTAWYAVLGAAGGSLAGDVTGTSGANTVAKLQAIALDLTTTPPVTGDVLEYSGSAIVPAHRLMRPLDTTYSPVGLWTFHLQNTNDTSGNGNNLTVEAGTVRYAYVDANLGGLQLDGSTRLAAAGFLASLALSGDMTVTYCIVLTQLAGAGLNFVIASHAANGAGAANNDLYAHGFDDTNQTVSYSETGVGVGTTYLVQAGPTRGQLTMVAHTRIGGVWQTYMQGRPFGPPSGAIAAPTGGANGIFRVGGYPAAGAGLNAWATVNNLGLYNFGWSAAQAKFLYNYVMGPAYGTIP